MEVNINPSPDFPEIENYRDYRKFVGDYYIYRKSQKSSFSYRQFASKVGLRSPNYLQLVIQNKRNLSNDLAPKVAKAMALSSVECQYFVSLVRSDNANSEEEIEQAQRELLVAVKHLCTKKIPLAQKQILNNWYHLVIRELVALSDFQFCGKWVVDKLRGKLSVDEAEMALNNLVKGGFIKCADKKWHQSEPSITTGEAFDELRVMNHHKDTLNLWSQSLFSYHESEREFGLVNIPISKNKIPELQKRIRDFQSEIIGWLQDEQSPDQVVQLGVYLMPVSK